MDDKIRVFFLAAEATPFVKVGGLGDVAGSLPKALRALAEAPDVRLALPFYPMIDRTLFETSFVGEFSVPHEFGPMPAQVYETRLDGMPVYLIDGPPLRRSETIYTRDARENGVKFTFFSMAALEFARAAAWQPDILHAHDWHTAPAVYCMDQERGSGGFFDRVATLLTVHNLPYLGVGAGPALGSFGLPAAENSTLPDWATHMPLPLGLLTADHINAVSPGYAAEMLSEEFGSGLHEFLVGRKEVISGILNGINTEAWNPESDPEIENNFTEKSLSERKKNKRSLQAAFELEFNSGAPLLAMVTRMEHQKGVDIALEGLRLIAERPWQAVILGTGEAQLEAQTRRLSEELPNKVRAVLRYDEALSRRIYAGADMLLLPSRYEPSGLTQMIAMRYGCVPIGRATGGLRDTIRDYPDDKKGTGFLFEEASPDALAQTLNRALDVYKDQRRWRGLQGRGMREDFSWKRSAQEYFELYKSLMKKGALRPE